MNHHDMLQQFISSIIFEQYYDSKTYDLVFLILSKGNHKGILARFSKCTPSKLRNIFRITGQITRS